MDLDTLGYVSKIQLRLSVIQLSHNTERETFSLVFINKGYFLLHLSKKHLYTHTHTDLLDRTLSRNQEHISVFHVMKPVFSFYQHKFITILPIEESSYKVFTKD